MRRVQIAAPILALGLAASIGLVAKAAPSTPVRERDPVPLRGAPLGAATGLRLLAPQNPPYALDVDTGTVIPSGIPALGLGTVAVVEIGGRAAVVISSPASGPAAIYAVRGREARVSPLGTGTNVWPAGDGRSVWVQELVDRSRCTLRQMGLDGQQIRAPRAFPCATVSDPVGSSLGLVVRRTRVVDPRTGRLVLRTPWGVLATAGTKLVLAGPGQRLTLFDGKTRAQQRLPQGLSNLGSPGRPAVDPRGRFVALLFGVPGWFTTTLPPGWHGGALQVLDVWILDAKSGKLTHLPGMPAFVALKRTSVAWTDDGRLVLLGESNGKDVVAVWRPGQPRLALKAVHLPERNAGSIAFAALR